MAAGVTSAPPTRLYHTIAPAARAASCSRLTLGTVATHRGLAPQFCFIMSMMSRAVVEWSSVTALSSGFGGAFTESQSSTMSPAKADAANARISATAATAAPRNNARMFDINALPLVPVRFKDPPLSRSEHFELRESVLPRIEESAHAAATRTSLKSKQRRPRAPLLCALGASAQRPASVAAAGYTGSVT